mmetsp:Transcript_40214/g.104111  ORF Transcript_40214/g.104111 Transcript_40214/m.104111 type:complete len:331 (-) Transcript_40214:478-1470(-)
MSKDARCGLRLSSEEETMEASNIAAAMAILQARAISFGTAFACTTSFDGDWAEHSPTVAILAQAAASIASRRLSSPAPSPRTRKHGRLPQRERRGRLGVRGAGGQLFNAGSHDEEDGLEARSAGLQGPCLGDAGAPKVQPAAPYGFAAFGALPHLSPGGTRQLHRERYRSGLPLCPRERGHHGFRAFAFVHLLQRARHGGHRGHGFWCHDPRWHQVFAQDRHLQREGVALQHQGVHGKASHTCLQPRGQGARSGVRARAADLGGHEGLHRRWLPVRLGLHGVLQLQDGAGGVLRLHDHALLARLGVRRPRGPCSWLRRPEETLHCSQQLG